MAKTKISEFSATPGNNTDIDGINIAEGCAPSGINNAIRELMAQLKDFQTGAAGDSFNGPVGTSTAAAGAFTTLTTSGAVTHNGGTANGVAYLNGSKVLTTGNSLTFDGSQFDIPAGTAAAPSLSTPADVNTGLYFPAADTIGLSTNGTERVRLDSSGNLGLGVTPSAWGSSNALQVGPWASLSSANAYGTGIGFNNFYNGTNHIYSFSNAATKLELGAGVFKFFTAPSGTAGNAISFTQAMTLDASGNLGVGVTSPAAKLHTNIGTSSTGAGNPSAWDSTYAVFGGTGSGASAVGIGFNGGGTLTAITPSSSWQPMTYWAQSHAFNTNGTERARIDSSGNLLPGADNAYSCGNSGRRWNAVWAAIGTIQTSDEREKTEIVDSPLGLDFINSLRPVAYKFKVGGNVISTDEDGNEVVTPVPGKRQHFGLLAQQVKQTLGATDFGGWIQTDPQDIESEQGLRYDEFISPLIKAIQEQQEMIQTLTARIAALEAK